MIFSGDFIKCVEFIMKTTKLKKAINKMKELFEELPEHSEEI